MKNLLLIALCLFAVGCSVTVRPIELDQPISIIADEKSKDKAIDSGSPAPEVKPEVKPEPKAKPKSNHHWTFPGKIEDHLQGDHKADISGLSREQMLDLHDSLHEAAKAAPPAEPKKLRNTIIQYTIKGCRWCDYDRERVLPQWVKKGWTFPEPVDESDSPKGAYPRYEIYDANGVKREHKGSLLSWKN
jgi:hypothetical protein